MMTAQEFESLMDDFAAHIEDFAVANNPDADGPFRSFLAAHPDLVTLIREREYDTHNRVRLSYDKTVADSWRAKVAELEDKILTLNNEIMSDESDLDWLFADIEERDKRIAELESLVREAEQAGVAYHEDGDSAGSDACPWCCVEVENERIIHAADCPAFSAPGVVRR